MLWQRIKVQFNRLITFHSGYILENKFAPEWWPSILAFVHRCSIYVPFFAEKGVTAISYLDLLELFLIPQLQRDTEVADILFQ
jgi:hypothetical protein